MADDDKNIAVWQGPLLMGVVSLIGLVLALLADNFFDYLSVLLLLLPCLFSVYCLFLKQSS